MNGICWLVFWISLILGIFFPPLWIWTLFALIGIMVFPTETTVAQRNRRYEREMSIGESAVRGLSPITIIIVAILLLKVFI